MHLLGSGFAQSTAIAITEQRVAGTSRDIESHRISNVKTPEDKDIFC